jgi:hypothetical protein
MPIQKNQMRKFMKSDSADLYQDLKEKLDHQAKSRIENVM